MLKLGLAYTLVLFAAFATVPACDSIDQAYDCDQICGRYAECFDADYDTGACESRCRNHADDDDVFAEQADDCETCLDDKSCVGSTFACGAECAGIVP